MRWTTKSTRKLAEELTADGHAVSATTVATLLKQKRFSLQANAKTLEGRQHAKRDAQFRYINGQARDHINAGEKIIKIKKKKKKKIKKLKKKKKK